MWINREKFEALQSDLQFYKNENTELRKRLQDLKDDCSNQLEAYKAFKTEYDEYRAKFDSVAPVTPPVFKQVGNVVHITRFQKQ